MITLRRDLRKKILSILEANLDSYESEYSLEEISTYIADAITKSTFENYTSVSRVMKTAARIVDESRELVLPNRLTDQTVAILNTGFHKLVTKLLEMEEE